MCITILDKRYPLGSWTKTGIMVSNDPHYPLEIATNSCVDSWITTSSTALTPGHNSDLSEEVFPLPLPHSRTPTVSLTGINLASVKTSTEHVLSDLRRSVVGIVPTLLLGDDRDRHFL